MGRAATRGAKRPGLSPCYIQVFFLQLGMNWLEKITLKYTDVIIVAIQRTMKDYIT